MEYFRILDLKKEPFSNSPDPEIFYRSRRHIEILQMVEMSIRLKRGLTVVLGDVGTGKTTLCRKLIQQLSLDPGNDVETHLVLDPSFSNPLEFLSMIMGLFGLNAADEFSEWKAKECIKKYLFEKGVEKGKTTALLLDEGQKLPLFCLEILRELLNYETNDCKLLQIVIFAQKEFREKIDGQANFADRINLLCTLGPLSFRETCNMVSYRIGQTTENGEGRRLFTYSGLWALYSATGGYPRSINTLCHHVALALIIQNRVKAGRSIVRACAARIAFKHRRQGRPRLIIASALLIVSLLLLAFSFNQTTRMKHHEDRPLSFFSVIGGQLDF